jgi:hypothetical protein
MGRKLDLVKMKLEQTTNDLTTSALENVELKIQLQVQPVITRDNIHDARHTFRQL